MFVNVESVGTLYYLPKSQYVDIKRNVGRIPYTAHGAQIPSPPYFLFLFIFYFYAYFRLVLPRRVRKEV